jgi:nitrate/TMAO reductase-like tetraheme cytochrome c subunit
MSKVSKSPKKKRFPWIPVIAAAGVVIVLLTAGGFAFAANQESHDPFCGSCHTQPESTFLERSTASQASDLASFHTTKNTLCIDCHSGQGISGRVQAELLGASNAAKWYTGTAVQPAKLLMPISDENCLKCHQNVTQRGFVTKESITVQGVRTNNRGGEGGLGHWHEQLAKWQATSATAGTCVSCHAGHSSGMTLQAGFMSSQAVIDNCNACHKVLRRGD